MLAKLQNPSERKKHYLGGSAVSAMMEETADLRETLAKTEQ